MGADGSRHSTASVPITIRSSPNRAESAVSSPTGSPASAVSSSRARVTPICRLRSTVEPHPAHTTGRRSLPSAATNSSSASRIGTRPVRSTGQLTACLASQQPGPTLAVENHRHPAAGRDQTVAQALGKEPTRHRIVEPAVQDVDSGPAVALGRPAERPSVPLPPVPPASGPVTPAPPVPQPFGLAPRPPRGHATSESARSGDSRNAHRARPPQPGAASAATRQCGCRPLSRQRRPRPSRRSPERPAPPDSPDRLQCGGRPPAWAPRSASHRGVPRPGPPPYRHLRAGIAARSRNRDGRTVRRTAPSTLWRRLRRSERDAGAETTRSGDAVRRSDTVRPPHRHAAQRARLRTSAGGPMPVSLVRDWSLTP